MKDILVLHFTYHYSDKAKKLGYKVVCHLELEETTYYDNIH